MGVFNMLSRVVYGGEKMFKYKQDGCVKVVLDPWN